MKTPSVPTFDFSSLPHEVLRCLAQDFNNEAYGQLMEEENMDDKAYRHHMIAIIRENAPSTAIH